MPRSDALLKLCLSVSAMGVGGRGVQFMSAPTARPGPRLSLEKMAEGGQRLHVVADDLSNRHHRNCENRARHSPHPKPEHQGDDHDYGIQGESACEKHRRHRFAFDEVNREIDPRGKQRLPQPVHREKTGEEEERHSGKRPEDRNVIQNERHSAPQYGIAEAASPHSQRGGGAYGGVHERDGHQICGNVFLDLLRQRDHPSLVLESRNNLDETAKERVSGEEQEEKDHQRLEKPAGEVLSSFQEPRLDISRGSGGRPSGASGVKLLQKGLKSVDWPVEEAETLFESRDAARQLFCPSGRRGRKSSSDGDNRSEDGENQQESG